MLRDPNWKYPPDTTFGMLGYKRIKKGVWFTTLNSHLCISNLESICSFNSDSYGVCDNYEQVVSLFDLEKDPRRFFVSLCDFHKCNEKPPYLWKWSKWGKYIGTQEPKCEYLQQEPVIETIMTFSVMELR